jgi:NADPH-dependent curcumin reductase CurA
MADAGPRRSLVLRARPRGAPTPDTFELVTDAVPQPGPGEVLTRAVWLSIAPTCGAACRTSGATPPR